MRLLLLNPYTSATLTERLAEQAALAATAGVTIRAVTAARWFPYISNRAEAQIAGAIVLGTLAQEAKGADAAIVAAFGDPGLRAARDLFPFPVIGISEASVLTASMLGRRFGIVGFTRRMGEWYEDCVVEIGMERRFSGFRAPGSSPRDPASAQENLREELLDCIRLCSERDGADVVIVAGAPLAGFAASVATEVPTPLIDPVAAAVNQAEAVARLMKMTAAPRHRWSDPKATTGLATALAARLLGVESAPDAFATDEHVADSASRR